jgi:DNA-binding CsgD family transcriptional regulator
MSEGSTADGTIQERRERVRQGRGVEGCRGAVVLIAGDRAIAEALAEACRRRGAEMMVLYPGRGEEGRVRTQFPGWEAVTDLDTAPGGRVLVVGDATPPPDGVSVDVRVPLDASLEDLMTAATGQRRVRRGGPRAVPPVEDPLTSREHEVVVELAGGIGTRHIAGRLGISEHTVRSHLQTAMGKLGVNSRAELVAWALRHRAVPVAVSSRAGVR